VLSRIEPRLTLTLGGSAGAGANLSFRELDDFHPDRLFERVELPSDGSMPHGELHRNRAALETTG